MNNPTLNQLRHILKGRQSIQYAAEYAEWTWYRSGGSEVGTVFGSLTHQRMDIIFPSLSINFNPKDLMK